MATSTNKTIALIPARGGSKRFPGKNLALLEGIPLLAHSIAYAKANDDIIAEVYVSTDDSDIKEVALAYGAKVIDRPVALSGDDAPTVTALQHALQHLPAEVKHMVLLQPTNPLRPVNLLKEAFTTFTKGNFDSLMTVSRNHHKLGKIIDGRFVPYTYTFGQKSQDLEPLFFENGLLYISKVTLLKKGVLLGENNCPFLVDHPFTEVDIDTEEDFIKAEMYLKHYGSRLRST